MSNLKEEVENVWIFVLEFKTVRQADDVSHRLHDTKQAASLAAATQDPIRVYIKLILNNYHSK